jgi:hypothetical protein
MTSVEDRARGAAAIPGRKAEVGLLDGESWIGLQQENAAARFEIVDGVLPQTRRHEDVGIGWRRIGCLFDYPGINLPKRVESVVADLVGSLG